MAFKYKALGGKSLKGTTFTKALDEVKRDFNQNVSVWRKGAVASIEGALVGTDKFFAHLDEAMALLQGNAKQMAVYESFFVDKATQEQFGNAIRQLSGTLEIRTTYEVDHKTMAPINQRLTLLILALEEMIDDLENNPLPEASTEKERQKQFAGRIGYKATRLGGRVGGYKTNQGIITGLKETAKRLGKVRAMGAVIEDLYNRNKEITPKSLLEGLNSLDKDGGRVDITFEKQKDVGLGPDGPLAQFAVTIDTEHGKKSKWQRVQGALRAGVLLGASTGYKKLDEEMFKLVQQAQTVLSKADLSTITGSESIADTLGKQAADTFKGKKTGRVKSHSRSTSTSRGKIRKPKGKNIAAKASLREIYSISRLAQVRTSRENNSVGIEKTKSADIQQELNKLRTLINRRLPAQVRRNMGRPALINRTGRFSNSVELQSLRPAGKTIVGTYSYQMNPYETFENTGEKQWPVGYNPKPLIAKSIRDLALEYTNQKLTLRRG